MLMRKTLPVARRVLGASHDHTLRMRWTYAQSLYVDPGATLDDLREAVATLEDAERIARRVLGESHDLTIRVVRSYARALYEEGDATLDDLREAVATLAETERTARRVLGGAHPVTEEIEDDVQNARAALRACEAPSASA